MEEIENDVLGKQSVARPSVIRRASNPTYTRPIGVWVPNSRYETNQGEQADMKFTRRHLTTAGALAVLGSALVKPSLAQSSDEASVNQAVEELNQAMLKADKAKLEELLSDKLSYGHSAGRMKARRNSSTWSQVRRRFTKRLQSRSRVRPW